MMMMRKKILLYLIVVVYFLLILITLTGCGSTSSAITISDKNTLSDKKEVVQRGQIQLVRDSVVYREKIRNDTVYLEILKEKTKIVHDTSYIYFAVSDTVYTVKYDKEIKEKLIKETPWYNYCIIIMLVMIILYLLIGKLFKP